MWTVRAALCGLRRVVDGGMGWNGVGVSDGVGRDMDAVVGGVGSWEGFD